MVGSVLVQRQTAFCLIGVMNTGGVDDWIVRILARINGKECANQTVDSTLGFRTRGGAGIDFLELMPRIAVFPVQVSLTLIDLI
jgi:hypothetical protein